MANRCGRHVCNHPMPGQSRRRSGSKRESCSSEFPATCWLEPIVCWSNRSNILYNHKPSYSYCSFIIFIIYHHYLFRRWNTLAWRSLWPLSPTLRLFSSAPPRFVPRTPSPKLIFQQEIQIFRVSATKMARVCQYSTSEYPWIYTACVFMFVFKLLGRVSVFVFVFIFFGRVYAFVFVFMLFGRVHLHWCL